MDVQIRTADLRTKIENQHQEAEVYRNKVQTEIEKVMEKIKLRAAQIKKAQVKMDSLTSENSMVLSQLKETERIVTLEKERLFGQEKFLNEEKARIRQQKFKLSQGIKNMMEKYTTRNEAEVNELENMMAQKFDKLESVLQ